MLLSSSGEELKRLELAPSIRRSKPGSNEFLVSASGRTVLLGQVLEDGVHYRVLEPNTLDTKLEWMQAAGSHSPWIVAISDKEMLGTALRRRRISHLRWIQALFYTPEHLRAHGDLSPCLST